MPSAPDISDFVTWKADTDREKWYNKDKKARSTELGNLDLWIQAYNASKKPTDLEMLKRSLGTWIGPKTKNDGTIKTIRDHSGAVTRLKTVIDNATRLVEPVIWDERFPGIFIAHDNYRGEAWVPDDFVSKTEEALNTIITQPVGLALIQAVSDKCRVDATKKVIIEYIRGGAIAAPTSDTSNEFRRKIQLPNMLGGETGFVASQMSNPDIVARPTGNLLKSGTIKEYIGGTGASAIICFNHNDTGLDGRPKFVALAHEMVHALHYLNGMCYRGIGDKIESGMNSGIMEEEMRTVGFAKYEKEVPSENAIRDEHRVPRRKHYIPDSNWDHVVASVFV